MPMLKKSQQLMTTKKLIGRADFSELKITTIKKLTFTFTFHYSDSSKTNGKEGE
jgi:hypothetical protein